AAAWSSTSPRWARARPCTCTTSSTAACTSARRCWTRPRPERRAVPRIPEEGGASREGPRAPFFLPRSGAGLLGRRRFRFGWPRRFRAHPLDGVAQLAAQDQLGVLGPHVQAVVEHQLVVLVRPHQLHLAQLLDEAAEQALVEELRRGRRVQQAQALRRQLAQALQLGRAERAGAVLHQHRDGDVVALEGLLQGVADGAQAEHLVALALAALQDPALVVVDLLQQALAHEQVGDPVDAL